MSGLVHRRGLAWAIEFSLACVAVAGIIVLALALSAVDGLRAGRGR